MSFETSSPRTSIRRSGFFIRIALSYAVVLFASAASAAKLTTSFQYDDLKALIQTKDLRSLESVIAELPPEFKKNFALMHRSRSLQGGSPEAPRAILFNDDGSLVISYSGHENLRGGDRFEIMTFDEATARFGVKTISFADEGGAPNGTSARASFEENPQNCFGCHGRVDDDLRPVWDPGLVWRGAYGSRDDSFLAASQDNEIRDEAEAYANFIGTVSSVPRFRNLDFGVRVGEGDRSDILTHPNLRLGLILMRQQAKRIARMIDEKINQNAANQPLDRQTHRQTQLKAALSKIAGCTPSGIEASFQPQIHTMLGRFLNPIYGQTFTDGFLRTEAPRMIESLYVGHALGLDITEWPLTVEKRTFAIFDGSFPFSDLLTTELLKRAVGAEPALAKHLKYRSLTDTALGLKPTPALHVIDSVSAPLVSIPALCSDL